MADTIRIRLRSGEHEIEIEAPRNDLDALLERWWASEGLKTQSGTTKSHHAKKKSRAATNPVTASQTRAEDHFDELGVANRLKEEQRFPKITEKVLHAGSQLQKVTLVCWYVDSEVTSGNIQRILEMLGVKISLPDVSKILKKHQNKFITPVKRKAGGAIPKYKLTSKARADFEKWLSEDE